MARNTAEAGITGKDRLSVCKVDGKRAMLWMQFPLRRRYCEGVGSLPPMKRPFKRMNVERSSATSEMTSSRDRQSIWRFSTYGGTSEGVGNVWVQRSTDTSFSRKTSLNKWYRLVESQEDEVRAHALKELASPCRWSITTSVNSGGSESGNGWMQAELGDIVGPKSIPS